MRNLKTLSAILILAAMTFVLSGWHKAEKQLYPDTKKKGIVLLKFKAQPDKGDQAVAEFNNLLDQVKKEPHFVSIKLHVDPQDKTNIMLYEEWGNIEYYNGEHMTTAHLKEFMVSSESFLAGPPEITFWEVKNIFE